jgi:DAK2 domain fusion protein YloV
MPTLERLGAADLAAVMVSYRDALRSHQERINHLNVYPVPDGDTGTNMALTLESVVASLPGPDADLAAVGAAIARGSLMGARGNSGVILSQILRGLAARLAEAEAVEGADLAEGLARAAEGAYRAVQEPVEGTILSVAAAAAEAARAAAGSEQSDLVAVAHAAADAAAAALARTPEQLPVLADAGVVDSGGAGLLLLFEALVAVIDGTPVSQPDEPASATPGPPASASPGAAAPGSSPGEADQGARYEVMYLLEAPEETIPAFRAAWSSFGDSIVVVGGDGLYNCHIHTDDIGAAIEAGLDVGRPRSIRVSDLWEQVEEERWVREATRSCAGVRAESEERHACAVVAVCAGEGIGRILRSLGVSRLVAGGPSMNPSTAELLAAIEDAPAEEVVVLPNNKNVVPVAEAAAASSAKPVRVVPTLGIPEGFAALLDYDPEADAATNAAAMCAASGRVVAGEVTQAVRAAASAAGPIAEGDYLGVTRQGILVVASSLVGAATGLLDRLIDAAHHEIVTVIAGEGASPADTRAVTAWVEEHHPGVAVETHQGGQPLYPYLFGVE